MFFLVYVILEAFAGLESRRVARGDFDFFARLRVFAFSCFSFTRFKSSEADKLNLVVLLYASFTASTNAFNAPSASFFERLAFSAIIATNSDLFIVTPPRSYTVILYSITDFLFLAIHTDDFCSFERKIAFAFIRKAKKS